ncbi:uncharacterized protein F4822DRAFT_446049 [Hypoxylon trugodes]|uniref:uncharacterized protein n=1 Tax=Hypoxylon trugodes TaxID=326681 RepID=UPI0021903E4E|nr:uncharacterized protein F4822DRAFT_446049 [Hypoxylon trugodes]KAI1384894.1 hypothetical protein F4822DRAFT_446049 [Hypoxylon trugodes]
MAAVYPAMTSDGVVTSFIPLTALFTPSARCSDYFRLNGPSLVAFDPGYGLDIDTAVRCVPSAVTTWWEQGRLGANDEGHTAISLGPLVCPYEWRTVATSVENESKTLAMCCPSGYYLGNGIPGSVVGDCMSDVSEGMLLTYASTSTANSDVWHTETTSLTESSTVGAIAIVGWNIQSSTPTPTPTPTSTAISTAMLSPAVILSSPTFTSNFIPTSPSQGSTSSPSPSLSSKNSSQISPGVATGIGVGVGLGVIGMAALLVTLYLMRRRKKNRAEATQIDDQGHGTTLTQQIATPAKHELHDPQSGRHELQGMVYHLGQYQGSLPIAELHE